MRGLAGGVVFVLKDEATMAWMEIKNWHNCINFAHIPLRVLPKTVKNKLLQKTLNSHKFKISGEKYIYSEQSESPFC
jgi:hypothetical protein